MLFFCFLKKKKWRKFGDCANLPAGPEPGVTSLGEEIFIEAVGRMGDQSVIIISNLES